MEAELGDGALEGLNLEPDELGVQQNEVEVVRWVDVTREEREKLGLSLQELLLCILFVGHLMHELIHVNRVHLEVLAGHKQSSEPRQLHLRLIHIPLRRLLEVSVHQTDCHIRHRVVILRKNVTHVQKPVNQMRSQILGAMRVPIEDACEHGARL